MELELGWQVTNEGMESDSLVTFPFPASPARGQ